MSILRPISIATLAAVLMTGCGLIYKPVGHTLNHYSQDEVLPYALASGDLNQTACGTGRGLSQLMGSFSRVITRPSKILLSTNTLSALCSETKAQSAHLHMLRALQRGNTEEAQDARIWSQRLQRRTALRRYQLYKDTVLAFGALGDGNCPDLDNYMGTDKTAAQFMVGTLTSVQGVLNDIKAGSTVGIPQDVARKAGRATECLDNEKWWGVPNALQAVVWLSVPGSTPEGVDPWTQLAAAADYGASQGMPLTPLLYAIAADGKGDTARLKKGIRQVVETYNSTNVSQEYLLLAQVAYSQAQFLSDQIWTQETGHRTPLAVLGTFPGDDAGADPDFDASEYL